MKKLVVIFLFLLFRTANSLASEEGSESLYLSLGNQQSGNDALLSYGIGFTHFALPFFGLGFDVSRASMTYDIDSISYSIKTSHRKISSFAIDVFYSPHLAFPSGRIYPLIGLTRYIFNEKTILSNGNTLPSVMVNDPSRFGFILGFGLDIFIKNFFGLGVKYKNRLLIGKIKYANGLVEEEINLGGHEIAFTAGINFPLKRTRSK